jgi:hypothetical protein
MVFSLSWSCAVRAVEEQDIENWPCKLVYVELKVHWRSGNVMASAPILLVPSEKDWTKRVLDLTGEAIAMLQLVFLEGREISECAFNPSEENRGSADREKLHDFGNCGE